MSISTKIKSKKKVKKEKPTEQKSIGSIKSRMGQKDDQPPVKQEHHVHQYDQNHENEDESGSQLSGGSNDSSEHIQTLPSNLKKQAHNTHQGNHNTPNQQQHQHQPYQQQMQEGQQQQQQYQHQQMQMQMQGYNQQNPNQMQQNQQMNNGQQQGFQNNNNQNMKQHEGAHKSKSNEILQDQQSSESNQQNNTNSSFKKRQSALDYQRSSLSISPDTIAKNKHINLVQKLKLEGSHLCLHHQQQFQFFCETCEEPICSQCTILGPHNNQLHRVNRMSEAFKSRYMKIQENIKDNLVTKREQILAQIHRVQFNVEYRVEEIKYIKTIIERDIRLEYEGLLDRLRQVEGTKLALLSHDISELQKDLDQINEIGTVFNDLTGSDMTDLSPFLLRSRYLYEQVEHLVAKPFKISIDVYPYDLPRELTELRLQLQKASAQKQLIEFKNEVIWKLMSEKKQDDLSQEFEKQTNEEVNEWSQLVDKFQGELDRFQVVCCYCGALLDPKIVNFPCGMNSQDSQPLVQTMEQPPYGFSGTNKHFFSKARN